MTCGVRVGQAHLEKGILQAFLQDSYKYGGDRQAITKLTILRQACRTSKAESQAFRAMLKCVFYMCRNFAHNNTYSLHSW